MTREDEFRLRAVTLQMQLGLVVLKARAALTTPGPESRAAALEALTRLVHEDQFDAAAAFAREAIAIEAARAAKEGG